MRAIISTTLIALAQCLGVANCAYAQTAPFSERNLSVGALIDALAPADNFGPTRNLRLSPADASAPASKLRREAPILLTFATNSADLTDDAKRALEVVAKAMKASQLAAQRFVIQGHADPRGSAMGNMRLSEVRAQAVRDYLVNELGISAERLTPVGRGDLEPLNPGLPAAVENRRVTFVTATN